MPDNEEFEMFEADEPYFENQEELDIWNEQYKNRIDGYIKKYT